MASLIYSPGIRVHVESSTGDLLDLTEDVTQWELNLRENGIHTFNFSLQNAQRKYDGRLLPMDRITVQLKRLNWMQNFTGYLNDGPIFQAWPGVLQLTASCTLKKPQFWPWDPTTIDSIAMIASVLKEPGGPGVADKSAKVGDHGLSRLVTESLARVVGWDRKKIHIGQIPNRWFTFAQKVGDLIEADTSMSEYLGGLSTVGGSYSGVQINIPSGRYGGVDLDDTQAKWASVIYNTVRGTLGGSTADAIATLMCSYQESRLYMQANENVPESLTIPHDRVGSNANSVGLQQQRVGIWGTAAELMNAQVSTQKFFKALQKVKGAGYNDAIKPGQTPRTTSMSLNDQVQAVQVSATPNAYGQWEVMATALCVVADGLARRSSGSSPNAFGTSANLTGSKPAGTGTGSQLAYVAKKLITDHPPGHIRYQLGGDDAPDNPDPRVLDCSSLVQWVYFNGSGGKRLATRTSEQQYAASVKIPVELACKVQGAAVFIVDGGDAHHVGISLGDGTHVAAHTDGIPIEKQVTAGDAIIGQFNQAGLLPGIDYSGSATDADSAAQLAKIIGANTTVAPGLTTIGGLASPAMEALIGYQVLDGLNLVGLGNVLPPRRALMNDQPFLPWLANLCNASMRSFCSAPNGDFMAWFPDYFGIWGTAAVMNIQLIELMDFTVRWSDQQMVTHEFVIGSPSGGSSFDPTTAGVSMADPSGSFSQSMLFLQTSGIATMDFPEIFQAIYGKSAPPGWAHNFLQRFGARPNVDMVPNIPAGRAEFFMALYNFMRYWAGMFTATVPLTFMPELWPGMLLRIPEFNFQAYVKEVRHAGSYGEGGGFTTDVSICAPSSTSGTNRMDLLSLLPHGK